MFCLYPFLAKHLVEKPSDKCQDAQITITISLQFQLVISPLGGAHTLFICSLWFSLYPCVLSYGKTKQVDSTLTHSFIQRQNKYVGIRIEQSCINSWFLSNSKWVMKIEVKIMGLWQCVVKLGKVRKKSTPAGHCRTSVQAFAGGKIWFLIHSPMPPLS